MRHTPTDPADAGIATPTSVPPRSLAAVLRPTEAELARARRALHLKAVVVGVAALASYWVLVLSPAADLVRVASGLVLVVALTTVATSVMHDANHGAFSRSRRVNRLLGSTLDLLGGSSWMWRHKHNAQHHASTNVVGIDRDIDQAPFARLAPQQAWRPWHRYQHLYLWPVYGLLPLRWLVGDLVTLARNGDGSPPAHRRRRRSVSLVVLGKLVHLAWAVALPLALHPWWAVLGSYLAISWSVGLLAALIFQMAHCVEEADFVTTETEHRGRSFQLHQLRTTLDVRCTVPGLRHVVRFVMGGLDHQIEHHLAPGLPHTIYPVLAERLAEACATQGLPYRSHRSVTAALRSHSRWLRAMGRQPASLARPAAALDQVAARAA